MTIESAVKRVYDASKSFVSDAYEGGKRVGADLRDVGGRAVEKTTEASKKALHASARFAYEQGRLKFVHTSNTPVLFDHKDSSGISLISISLPLRLEEKRWRAMSTSKVWGLWGSEYPAVLMELEDPNPNLEGEEAIRLTVHGDAEKALGSSDIAWRMWMPGRFAIKIDAQGTLIEKPQAEMTAGDVVSLLADTVRSESNGRLSVAHRDLHLGLSMISERSTTLEKRWRILEERLKFNMHLVNKPEEVAGLILSMIVIDSQDAKNFVRDLRQGQITGWSSLLDKIDTLPLRVYGSFATLLGEGQRMLPSGMSDPSRSTRMPASVLLGNYNVLYFINRALENEKLRPQIKQLADLTIENQGKALAIGTQILLARGQGFDEARRRVKAGTPALVRAIGTRTDRTMKKLETEIGAVIDSGTNPTQSSIAAPKSGSSNINAPQPPTGTGGQGPTP